MLRSISKQSGESVESVRKKKMASVVPLPFMNQNCMTSILICCRILCYSGKDLQKRKVLSLEWKSEGVMDDESGDLMELVEEVSLKELTDVKVERLVRG